MGAEGEDDDDDDAGPDDSGCGGGKRSKKAAKTLEGMYKGIDASGVSLNVDTRKWSVFKPKDGAMKRGFSLPSMKSKDGKIIELQPTYAALGTRRAIEIPPRPLHDPMGEHAIVLFDPTIDDAEAEREKERLRLEQDEQEKLNAQNVGPHKSLADLLGLNKKKTKVVEKVPVVIDPRLAKVLRPHQIEGVKVSRIASYEASLLFRDGELTGFLTTWLSSSCISVQLVSSTQRHRAVSWLTRWVWASEFDCCQM
jgi:DNA repair and recombination RAD54-like protein